MVVTSKDKVVYPLPNLDVFFKPCVSVLAPLPIVCDELWGMIVFIVGRGLAMEVEQDHY